MTGHRISLSRFKKIEIIPTIFSDNNDMKLEINNKRKAGKFMSMWKLNNTLLNKQDLGVGKLLLKVIPLQLEDE